MELLCDGLTDFFAKIEKAAPLDIVIVGAGLSGLGAAISCAFGGHKVRVLESAPAITEVIGAFRYVTSQQY